MDYELPEELRMLKETLRRFVDREIIPIERDAYEGHQLKPEVRGVTRRQGQGPWSLDVRCTRGIWRDGHELARPMCGLGRDGAHHRDPDTRGAHLRALGKPDPLFP